MIKHLVIPVIGMISLIVVFYFIETPAKILGGIWLLVGIVYLAVKTKRLQAAAARDEDRGIAK